MISVFTLRVLILDIQWRDCKEDLSEGETYKRVSERTMEDLAGVQNPLVQIAETEGGVDHRDDG